MSKSGAFATHVTSRPSYERRKCVATAAFAKYAIVAYAATAPSGHYPKVTAATPTAAPGPLMVALQAAADAGATVEVVSWLFRRDVDTSSYSVGPLYVTGAGTLSSTPPSDAGDLVLPVGYCFVSDASAGVLFLNPGALGGVPGKLDSGRLTTALAAAAGTGVALTEETLTPRTVTLTLTDVDLALTDEAGVVAYAGLKVLDFPEGVVCILGAVADLDLTKSSAGVNVDWDGDFSLGTVTASNNGTLAGTEANIIPSTATPQAAAGATTANGKSTATECPAYLDGTSTPVDVFLNVLVDDADHDVTGTACNLIANGTLKITYVMLGDY